MNMYRNAMLIVIGILLLFEPAFAKGGKAYKAEELALIEVGEQSSARRIGEFSNLKINTEEIWSYNVVLMDEETGEILYKLDENEKVYPASLTKIITTMVAIEDNRGEGELYEFDHDLIHEMIMEDATMAGFLEGDKVDKEDLIYGCMLPSGGEASIGLAEMTSGSSQAHVERMNKLVEDLGMSSTHFTNVTGLHHPENYSTAKELAEITRVGLRNPEFDKIFTSPGFVSSPTAHYPNGVYMDYSVRQFADELDTPGIEILGGKTGFTEKAGLCLASAAIVDGKRYILVTLGSEGQDGHFLDALTIYSYLDEYLN